MFGRWTLFSSPPFTSRRHSRYCIKHKQTNSKYKQQKERSVDGTAKQLPKSLPCVQKSITDWIEIVTKIKSSTWFQWFYRGVWFFRWFYYSTRVITMWFMCKFPCVAVACILDRSPTMTLPKAPWKFKTDDTSVAGLRWGDLRGHGPILVLYLCWSHTLYICKNF